MPWAPGLLPEPSRCRHSLCAGQEQLPSSLGSTLPRLQKRATAHLIPGTPICNLNGDRGNRGFVHDRKSSVINWCFPEWLFSSGSLTQKYEHLNTKSQIQCFLSGVWGCLTACLGTTALGDGHSLVEINDTRRAEQVWT